MIVKQCFDLDSYDIYQPNVIPTDVPWASLVGSSYWQHASVDEFVDNSRRSDELVLVRTHEFVPDQDRAIYVVRDGRAVLLSYQRFLSRFADVDAPLSDLIEGKCWPGKWSDHVERWLAKPSGTTLVLRYEELSGPSGPPLDLISSFIDRPIQRPFEIKFADLHAMDAQHFDVGHNNEGIEVINRDFSTLFWDHNGDAMRRLGYA